MYLYDKKLHGWYYCNDRKTKVQVWITYEADDVQIAAVHEQWQNANGDWVSRQFVGSPMEHLPCS